MSWPHDFAGYYKSCPMCLKIRARPHYSKQGKAEHFYDGQPRLMRFRCPGSDVHWTEWGPYDDDWFERSKVRLAQILRALAA